MYLFIILFLLYLFFFIDLFCCVCVFFELVIFVNILGEMIMVVCLFLILIFKIK